ncbi:MAG TPA: hypothetical protein VFR86_17780, partial [Burkholderiaceae bacterium]|nr:hypothetical protein [Burkholderiaceae bacterium]
MGSATPSLVSATHDANREAAEVAREREAEIPRRVDDLASEVRRLRAELDAAGARNRELTAKSKSNGYAWTAGGVAVVLLSAGFVLGWRNRRPQTQRWEEDENIGPMTRIMGREERLEAAHAARPMMAMTPAPSRGPAVAPAASMQPV